MPKKWLERDRGYEDTIEDIFSEMREMGIEFEGRGDTLVYTGPVFEAEIKDDRAHYWRKDGHIPEDDLMAWGYMESLLKSKGYQEVSAPNYDQIQTDLKTAD